jgi:hypothetical protein
MKFGYIIFSSFEVIISLWVGRDCTGSWKIRRKEVTYFYFARIWWNMDF